MPSVVDALVIGGGMGGLSAAYALTRHGLRPVLCEERGRCGGLVAGMTFDKVSFDIGAESYVSSAHTVSDLVKEVGLDVGQPHGSSWVYTHEDGGRAIPIPHGMLGIPASLDDPIVTSALEPHDLARARKDLTMGPEPGSDARDVASFVRARFGEGLLRTFVAPIAGGIHAADPATLNLDTVCRGLREALAREGSATAAVASLRGLHRGAAPVVAPVGGMFRLPEALAHAITHMHGHILTRHHVDQLTRARDGWHVVVRPTRPADDPSLPPIPYGTPQEFVTQRVVVALPAHASLDLLQHVADVDGWTVPDGSPIAHITLMLHDEGLDEGPRGSGMLVRRPTREEYNRGAVRAKALTHYSYKWPWVLREHPHTHIFRISYGRPGEDMPPLTCQQACMDASRMLDYPLDPSRIDHSAVIRWGRALPPLDATHWERVGALTADLEGSGLGIAGSWASGTGLSAVIPHALHVGATLSTIPARRQS